ncbi:MAG: hypothetical protein H6525_10540 [Actinobacteria bacterium]|nr:hypothetical protein [Actinomycetota bacterium]MCB9413262.1 hypothetical protein [Actinomycetota bacterium]
MGDEFTPFDVLTAVTADLSQVADRIRDVPEREQPIAAQVELATITTCPDPFSRIVAKALAAVCGVAVGTAEPDPPE